MSFGKTVPWQMKNISCKSRYVNSSPAYFKAFLESFELPWHLTVLLLSRYSTYTENWDPWLFVSVIGKLFSVIDSNLFWLDIITVYTAFQCSTNPIHWLLGMTRLNAVPNWIVWGISAGRNIIEKLSSKLVIHCASHRCMVNGKGRVWCFTLKN